MVIEGGKVGYRKKLFGPGEGGERGREEGAKPFVRVEKVGWGRSGHGGAQLGAHWLPRCPGPAKTAASRDIPGTFNSQLTFLDFDCFPFLRAAAVDYLLSAVIQLHDVHAELRPSLRLNTVPRLDPCIVKRLPRRRGWRHFTYI